MHELTKRFSNSPRQLRTPTFRENRSKSSLVLMELEEVKGNGESSLLRREERAQQEIYVKRRSATLVK
jgi:hypothetical protein